MDLPLVLVLRRDGALVYRIPVWFRIAMGIVFAAVTLSLFYGGHLPGTVGWIVIAILFLALIYRETWVFDQTGGEVRHRFGLLIAARSLTLPFGDIGVFRLVPWVRGSIPGSAEEKLENRQTLEASRGRQIPDEPGGKRRPRYRKPFLTLVLEAPGKSVTINMVPARRAIAFRAIAEKIARYCDKPLEEG